MKTLLPVLVLLVVMASSCRDEYALFDGLGKKPVYITESQLADIKNTAPVAVTNSGPIYLQDSLLFMVERGRGIHIFNVADTANPVNLTFIQIPAVNDFSLSGNMLYADNGPNLVTLNVSDIYSVQVLSTQTGVFQPVLYPAMYEGIFECGDPSKGIIVEWIDTVLKDVRCSSVNF